MSGRVAKFHESSHARNRSAARDISLEVMKHIVKYPDTRKQQYRGSHGGFVYKFVKMVDPEQIAVIAETYKSECWLISAFRL